ncbi:MAG: ATP-binding cassette domain-containing protein [Acidobacteria bacterium]|nr:ATP-binding cassette domain-containing protein [Acidobacteriota bacterium]
MATSGTLHTDPHHLHPSPVSRLGDMLWEDRSDLLVLLVYTVMTGVLALAVPLAAQALVNTIAANVLTQPLVVLTLIVFVGLLFAGVLRVFQLMLVEALQQRIFVRVALQLAKQLPRIRHSALVEEYAPELVNRFFDVLTVQKAFAKLLLDGLTALLQVSVGLVLMAFYNPLLLVFDSFLVLFAVFVVVVLGIGGLRTSIQESAQKYAVAAWLEELARCHSSFKMSGTIQYLVERADVLTMGYIKSRRLHFRVLLRQAIGNFLFQAIANAGILAVGGWLVINRQLTLGQLVAAELIVVAVLAAMEKLIKQLDEVYDLLTGLDKIGHITDLEVERLGGNPVPKLPEGASVVCRDVHFAYRDVSPILSGLNLTLHPGDRVSLVGASGVGKSTLVSLMCGLNEPSHGTVEINGVDVRVADLESLRQVVGLVGDANDIFEGTIEENIRVGRAFITHEDIRKALEIAQLTHDLALMPRGLKTELISGGRNLSRGQIQRLLIARATVGNPQLLILDEAFIGIDEKTKLTILDAIFDQQNKWTIIDISHDPEVVTRSASIYLLANGKIVESGRTEEIISKPDSAFGGLFPLISLTYCRLQQNS